MLQWDRLSGFALFKNADRDTVEGVLRRGAFIQSYTADSMIRQEGQPCQHIGFVLSGTVSMLHQYPSGRVVAFEHLEAGDTLAAALLYAGRPYPATAWAQSEVQMLFVPRDTMTELLHSDAHVMQNFIGMLSSRVLALHDAIRMLSQKGVLQRVALYLLDRAQEGGALAFTLEIGRGQLGERLGAPRPSISRAFVQLRERGIIDFTGRSVRILDSAALEGLID